MRRHEEEERRKREEEIRRIRDLSNQDEQYNRFMKLVGGKMRTHSRVRPHQPHSCLNQTQMSSAWVCRTELLFHLQSTEREHRKSTGKQCLDASGNLYQYDNYDEVAMDTDSEAGSPGEGSSFSWWSSLWIQPLSSVLFSCFSIFTHSPPAAC